MAEERKPLAEMTDAELEAERERRRRARTARGGASAITEPPAGGRVARALESLQREREIAQAYANLELKPGATVADIEKKYAELSARYSPDKHKQSPERHRAATELVAQLGRARSVLVTHLGGRG